MTDAEKAQVCRVAASTAATPAIQAAFEEAAEWFESRSPRMISYVLLLRLAGQSTFSRSSTHVGVRPEDGLTLSQVLNMYPNITTGSRVNGSECILFGPLQGEPELNWFIFNGEALAWEPIYEDPEPFISIAAHFHDEYEAAAEEKGWETQERSRVAFDELPPENRETMVATVKALFERKLIAPGANL